MTRSNHNTILANPPVGSRARMLIIGFFRKELTPEQMDELDDWIASSEENMIVFESWINLEIEDPSLAFLKEEFLMQHSPKKKIGLPFPMAAAIAGLVLLSMTLVFEKRIKSFFNPTFTTTTESIDSVNVFKTTKYTGPNNLTIRLPDSTTAILASSTSLTYPLKFDPAFSRLVKLAGSARFGVVDYESTAFRISIKNYELRTSHAEFSVIGNLLEDSIQIQVFSGQLRFADGKDAWYLNAGEKASYSNKTWSKY